MKHLKHFIFYQVTIMLISPWCFVSCYLLLPSKLAIFLLYVTSCDNPTMSNFWMYCCAWVNTSQCYCVCQAFVLKTICERSKAGPFTFDLRMSW